MKKKMIIAALIFAAAVILFVPFSHTVYEDGGTKEYKALTYKIIKWNRLYGDGLNFQQTSVYRFPDNFKDIDTLWEEIDIEPVSQRDNDDNTENTVFRFPATVLEVNEGNLLVEPADESSKLKYSDRVYIPDKLVDGKEITGINAGDRIEITFNGVIFESYPEQIDTVYEVNIIESETSDSSDNAVPTEPSGKKESGTVPYYNGTGEPVLRENQILIEHNGQKVYITEADSEYIKSVILNFEETAACKFYGNKDYTIRIGSNPFGGTETVYYDTSDGLLGNSSIGYLHDKDKAKFDTVLGGYFDGTRQGATIKATEIFTSGYEYNSSDKVHYIRSYAYFYPGKTAFPYAAVIRSTEELKKYRDDNKTVWYFDSNPNGENYISFDEAVKKYDARFFENNALIFVITQEPSGSIFYKDANISGNTVNITKYRPEVCTCDMAYWHIIFEVSQNDPAIGQKIQINITE